MDDLKIEEGSGFGVAELSEAQICCPSPDWQILLRDKLFLNYLVLLLLGDVLTRKPCMKTWQ